MSWTYCHKNAHLPRALQEVLSCAVLEQAGGLAAHVHPRFAWDTFHAEESFLFCIRHHYFTKWHCVFFTLCRAPAVFAASQPLSYASKLEMFTCISCPFFPAFSFVQWQDALGLDALCAWIMADHAEAIFHSSFFACLQTRTHTHTHTP